MIHSIPDDIIIKIHNSVHSTENEVDIDGNKHEIIIGANNCRNVTYQGIQFMEQNKRTSSMYATMAQKGHKITWGMKWYGSKRDYVILVKDGIIEKNEK